MTDRTEMDSTTVSAELVSIGRQMLKAAQDQARIAERLLAMFETKEGREDGTVPG